MNLWDLVEQIRDPDGWRERKVAEMRRQWGYDSAPIKNQGGAGAPVYTDSLPLSFQDGMQMQYPKLMDIYKKTEPDLQGQLAPDKWPKGFFSSSPYKGTV